MQLIVCVSQKQYLFALFVRFRSGDQLAAENPNLTATVMKPPRLFKTCDNIVKKVLFVSLQSCHFPQAVIVTVETPLPFEVVAAIASHFQPVISSVQRLRSVG